MRILVALLALPLCLPAQKHAITHEDIWQMKRVTAPAVSPDGKWAVVSVTEPSYDSSKTVSDLWIVPLDASAPPRRLTNTRASEDSAVFSPDSTRLAFTTKREADEHPQVYILPLNGGEALRATDLSTGASDPKWRPDGKAILFESRVYPGAATDADNQRIAAERKARKYNMRAFDTFPFRYWDHWLDDLRPHIFVQPLEPGARAQDILASTGLAAQPGFDGESGLSSAHLDPVWTPDGQSIVFVAIADRDQSAYAPTTSHLYRISAGGGEAVPITSGPASYSHPVFSPDGRTLYALHHKSDNETLYSLARLVSIAWPEMSARPRFLTPQWDRSVDNIALAPDGRRIYVTAEDQAHDKLFAISADGGAPQLVLEVKEGLYSGLVIPQRAAKPLLVALWGSMVHPEDLVVIDPESRRQRFLSAFNKDAVAQIDWQPPREFWFTSKAGKRIQSLPCLRLRPEVSAGGLPPRRPAQYGQGPVLRALELSLPHHPRLCSPHDQLHRLHRLRGNLCRRHSQGHPARSRR
jgi:Tol biopolymer transport system component